MPRFSLSLLLFVSLLAMLAIVSLIDVRAYVHVFMGHQDKVFHVLAFAFLLGFSQKLNPAFNLLQNALLLLAFGLLIEILQKALTHGLRQFSVYDVLFNLLGISLGWLIFYVLGQLKLKQQSA